jgi:hypothetical protein
MESAAIRTRLEAALHRLLQEDRYLLENDLSERCIASRLAMYLQESLPEYNVDVEYNRDAAEPKRLDIPEGCANRQDEHGRGLVVPDVVVHRRGRDGPNILVLEVKKTSNPESFGCDRERIRALRARNSGTGVAPSSTARPGRGSNLAPGSRNGLWTERANL